MLADRWVEEFAEVFWDVVAEVVAETKDEPTLGGWGSGVKVDSKMFQTSSPSGLKLLLRSPSPSKYLIW